MPVIKDFLNSKKCPKCYGLNIACVTLFTDQGKKILKSSLDNKISSYSQEFKISFITRVAQQEIDPGLLQSSVERELKDMPDSDKAYYFDTYYKQDFVNKEYEKLMTQVHTEEDLRRTDPIAYKFYQDLKAKTLQGQRENYICKDCDIGFIDDRSNAAGTGGNQSSGSEATDNNQTAGERDKEKKQNS